MESLCRSISAEYELLNGVHDGRIEIDVYVNNASVRHLGGIKQSTSLI